MSETKEVTPKQAEKSKPEIPRELFVAYSNVSKAARNSQGNADYHKQINHDLLLIASELGINHG